MLKALHIRKDDTVLSITSGGCNTLALISQKPARIFAIDRNQQQNYLLELKFAAYRYLSYENMLAFNGIEDADRLALFDHLSEKLTPDCRKFWRTQKNDLQRGIIRCGRFETYLSAFRRFILPLCHSAMDINDLLKVKSPHEQELYYLKIWENLRWKLIFRLFFSRLVMSSMGRGKDMFRFSQAKHIGLYYRNKTKKALSGLTAFRNPYLEFILNGRFGTLPLNLRSSEFKAISEFTGNLSIRTIDILDFLKEIPDNSITKFNLSDIFETQTEAGTHLIFNEIFRKGTDGARIIFWNNLVTREVPSDLKNHFLKDVELEKTLSAEEKVFFYSSLNIYTLSK